MKIKSEKISARKKTQMLCSFVYEKSSPERLGKLDTKLDSAVKQSIKEIEGKKGKLSVIHTHGIIPAKRILIAGLGKKSKQDTDTLRFVSGKIAKKSRELGLDEYSVILPKGANVSEVVEGSLLSLYTFDKFKSKKEKKSPNITILSENTPKIKNAIKISEKVSEAAIFTKSIANLPPNQCSPSTLAGFAKSMASKNKIKCTIYDKSKLKKNGFGGITAVGQGSKNEPRLIILEHNRGKRNEKPIVLVGKAVTFDTGGISLKPSDKMDEMKFDKCGGCTVLGIMKAVSELRLPLNVIGIVPSVENMPGGESYRPGDIVKLYGGKTAEILNTDAEGRLILSDALSYGEKKYSPKAIIDFATLTGACIVALGTNVAGMVSNNDSFANKIKKSSENTAEEIWQLPINDDYMDMIKSEVADMRNMGIGRAAGTITAAAFLKNAIKDTPWVHLDIAGVAWTQTGTKEKPYNPKGATGFGVRLVLDYLQNI